MSLPGVEASFPFDQTTLVFKVMGKMFCLIDITDGQEITVKANPEDALTLRETYEQVRPGYHMNNKHWITVLLEGLPESLIHQLIQQSHALVVQKLPKKDQIILHQQYEH